MEPPIKFIRKIANENVTTNINKNYLIKHKGSWYLTYFLEWCNSIYAVVGEDNDLPLSECEEIWEIEFK